MRPRNILAALCLASSAACTNEQNLAIAASSGQLSQEQLYAAKIGMETLDALEKATTPEEKAAIMVKHYCNLNYEYRRPQWLSDLGYSKPDEYSRYMRSDPVTRAKYWKEVGDRIGCQF